MGNFIGNCCSSDQNGHEETSKILPKTIRAKKKSTTYLIDSDKLKYLNDQHDQQFDKENSNTNQNHLQQKGRFALTENGGSTILDRADTEANCKIDASQIKEHEKSNIDIHDEDNDNINQNVHTEAKQGFLEGRQGLMVGQTNFSKRELHDVFT